MVQSIALEGIISCFVFHFHKDKLIFRFHELSHSHVAYLINKGIEPLLIKERVGHKDIRITLNTYGHLYPNQQRRVADLLDNEKGNSPDSGNC